MAKSEHASAVTAIHGSDFESFAASTLFSQGWSVLYRALDWVSLNDFLQGLETQPDVLLISTDLEGLDPQSLHKLTNSGMRIFIFRKSDADLRQFPDSFAQPTVALELIAMIRGSMRRPMLRVSEPITQQTRAHVLAIAAAHAGAGCTSLSINIATELSLLAKKVLIIDANAISPAIAILLGQQGLNSAKSVTFSPSTSADAAISPLSIFIETSMVVLSLQTRIGASVKVKFPFLSTIKSASMALFGRLLMLARVFPLLSETRNELSTKLPVADPFGITLSIIREKVDSVLNSMAPAIVIIPIIPEPPISILSFCTDLNLYCVAGFH